MHLEFLLTEVSVGVTPLCLFSHVGYCCSCLPSYSVYSKQASVQAAAQVKTLYITSSASEDLLCKSYTNQMFRHANSQIAESKGESK